MLLIGMAGIGLIAEETPSVRLTGVVENRSLSLDSIDLNRLQLRRARVKTAGGEFVACAVAALGNVLELAGVRFGDALKEDRPSTKTLVLLSSQASIPAKSSLEGMVWSVDTKSRSIGVITGVGHALSLVQIQVDPAAEIKVAGTAAKLNDLKRGDIVRVRYGKTVDRNLAESIERLQPVGAGTVR